MSLEESVAFYSLLSTPMKRAELKEKISSFPALSEDRLSQLERRPRGGVNRYLKSLLTCL